MPKIKLEKIAGVVALSYLVLIPAAGALAYRKVSLLEQDNVRLRRDLGMPDRNPDPVIALKQVFKRATQSEI